MAMINVKFGLLAHRSSLLVDAPATKFGLGIVSHSFLSLLWLGLRIIKFFTKFKYGKQSAPPGLTSSWLLAKALHILQSVLSTSQRVSLLITIFENTSSSTALPCN